MNDHRADMPKGNILIVDDTPANLRLLSQMLAKQAYKVRAVTSGPRALAAVRATPPDLILLDIKMPEMNGYEVCERLKADEQTRDIPIIFISALDETGDKVEAFTVGGVDYITKPFQLEEVLARVKTHLTLREQRTLAETLREVTLALTSQTSHEAVLDEILRQAHRLAPYTTANIMLLEDDILRTARWQGYQADSEELISNLVQPLADLPLDAEAIQSRKPLAIPDTRQEPRWMVFDETAWIRSYITVPICLRDRVLGLLRLDSDTPGEFSVEDARRLHPFANAAAIAIENARLFEQTQRQVREFSALNQVAAAATSTLDLHQLLDLVATEMAQIFDVIHVGIAVLDESRTYLTVVADQPVAPDGSSAAGIRIPVAGNPSTIQVIETGQPLSIPDAQTNPLTEPIHDLMRERGTYCLLIVPLIARDEVIGTIGMDIGQPGREFTPEEIALTKTIAGQVSVQVENAELFQETVQAAERRAVLHRASQEIGASLDLERIYAAIHQAAAQVMPSEVFVIALLDELQQEIEFVYLIDRGERLSPQRISVDRGLSGYVIATGEALRIDDFKQFGDIDVIHVGGAEHVRSGVAVPIRLGGKVIGLLSAQGYQPHTYTTDDQELLELLANQAAIAIENARLFGEVQRLAITDPLTGLHNRRHFFELAEHEFDRVRRYKHPLSAIMLDFDHFKKVNDTYGHAVGDQVLQTVAVRCRENLREVDILGRYGGEEFAILLPETASPVAQQTAERLRQCVAEASVLTDGGPVAVTISLGVAGLTPDTPDLASLLDHADSAMYVAKQAGRNRVVVK